eukprot:NODE_114_length_18474_cov_1.567510.p8 type:complete len:205 gc:universal NODE_114_length_18474_cov_1.567510:6273-5659(-)
MFDCAQLSVLVVSFNLGIIAQKCGAYTILAQLLNEYRYPEVNVQNGVLKSIAFIFEYIGNASKDYVYVASTLVEDALVDRDIVHRHIACQIVKHLATGTIGKGKEDTLTHMLNMIWPNLFENSSNMLESVFESIEALRLALGAGAILQYILLGLFHPARRIRETYWQIFNGIYISGQDDLVPYYPEFENEDKRMYKRHVLDYLI